MLLHFRLQSQFFFRFCITRLAVKLAKVNDRLFLGLLFIVALAGVILIGDWQGIGHDLCSLTDDINSFNTSTNGSDWEDIDYSQSGMVSTHSALNSGEDGIITPEDYLLSPLPLSDGVNSSNSSLYNWWVESCEALSSSSHQCFWNPKSRITGEFCNTCHRACYSEQKSLNFYQFSIGMLLVCLATPLGFVFVSSITSAYTPIDHQVSSVHIYECKK